MLRALLLLTAVSFSSSISSIGWATAAAAASPAPPLSAAASGSDVPTLAGVADILGAYRGLAAPVRPSGTNPIKGAKPNENWLLPILIFGPNNQVTGLKEGLALSRLLGRTTILPNIYDHYSQLDTKNGSSGDPIRIERPFEFDEVFNAGSIDKFGKNILLRDIKSSGWNGRLDALLYWSDFEFKYLERIKTHNITGGSATKIQMQGQSVCYEPNTAFLKARISRHRFVGVLIYNRLIKNARHESLSRTAVADESRRCYELYRKATLHLQRSPFIQSVATNFIKEHLGDNGFVAAQVRPYPDTCLSQWHTNELGSKGFGRGCANPRLHEQIGVQTVAVAQQAQISTSRVFVAAHPHARKVVDRVFNEKGLVPVYLEPMYVLHAVSRYTAVQATHLSMTILLFVEQEIASRSTVFIGASDCEEIWVQWLVPLVTSPQA